MNYRFVKVTNYYKNFLKYYYLKNPQISSRSYSERYDNLMSEAFGCSNYYQTHLNKLGNEAYEIVANAEPLQTTWAIEHNLNLNGEDPLL